jgi:hypothetical protein
MLTISICQASYKSGKQSILVRDEWFKRAKFKNRIEHCLGFEKSDASIRTIYGISNDMDFGLSPDKKTKFITTKSKDTSSAVRNWNNAASISTGEFLLLIADDLVPEHNWDYELETFILRFKHSGGVFKFTDDRCTSLSKLSNDTLLPRHPGMFRKTYTQRGFVFDPIFSSTGPDLDLLIQALKEGSLRDARKVKFHHSIGPILSENSNLICGCESVNGVKASRTISQRRIHSQSQREVQNLLRNKWRFDYYLLAQLACINRLSNYIATSMKKNRKNQPVSIITKSLIKYILYKYQYSGIRKSSSRS